MDSRAAHSPVFLVFPPDITTPEFQSGHVTGTTYDSSMPFPKLLAARMKILGHSATWQRTSFRTQPCRKSDLRLWVFRTMRNKFLLFVSHSVYGTLLKKPELRQWAVQILLGVMNFSFGIVLLFTLEDPYPRFPFIFISGYPFWSSILFVNSGAFLVALERKTTETLVALSRVMNLLSAVAAAAGISLLVTGYLIDQDFFCGYAGEASECQAVTTLFIMLWASAFPHEFRLIQSIFGKRKANWNFYREFWLC
nr:membrane-spanning 4-domains subfamily A member 5 isoform X2 [Odocoileus virginianus texanus]